MEDLSDYDNEELEEHDHDVKPNWEDIRIPSPELQEHCLQNSSFANDSSSKSLDISKIRPGPKSKKLKLARNSICETLDICCNCNSKFKSKDMICEISTGDNSTPKVSNERALVYVYELNGRESYNLPKKSVFSQHNYDFPLCLDCSSSLTEVYKSLNQFSNLCRLGSIISQKLQKLEDLHASFYKRSYYNSEEPGFKKPVIVKVEPEDEDVSDEDVSDEEGHASDDANNSDTSANYETTTSKRRFQPEASLSESSRPRRTVKKRSYVDFDTFSNDGSAGFSENENEDLYKTNAKNKSTRKLRTRTSSKSDKFNDPRSGIHASEDSLLDIDSTNDSNSKTTDLENDVEDSKGESHTCSYCFKNFARSSSLRIHIRFHTNEGNDELTCKICRKKFSRKYHLNRHLKSVHFKNKGKIHPRKNDEQNVSNSTSPTSSAKTLVTSNDQNEAADDSSMDNNDQSRSNNSSDNEDIQIDQQKSKDGLKNDALSCPDCSRTFMTANTLRQHMRIHTDDDNDKLTCKVCSRKFTREHHVTRHMKIHLRDGNYNSRASNSSSSKGGKNSKKHVTQPANTTCEYCGLKFEHLGNFRRHLRTHTDEYNDQLTCNICDKTFSRKEHLKRHLNNVHGKKNNSASQNTNENDDTQSTVTTEGGGAVNTSEKESLMCEYCSKTFTNSFNLRRHVKKHIDDENDNLTCNVCSETFSENGDLVTHMKSIHDIDFKAAGVRNILIRKCPVCSEEFNCNLVDFEEHVKTHCVESPFGCDQCPKKFASYKYLQQHVFRRHNELNEKLACQVCGTKFAKCHLAKHQRERHFVPNNISIEDLLVLSTLDEPQEEEDDNTFSCSVCSKIYFEKKHLTAHMLKHTSEAPYRCNVCSKGFFLKRSMDRHKLLHSNENPFACATCGKGYTRADHLKAHIERFH